MGKKSHQTSINSRPFPRQVSLPCPTEPPADAALHFSTIKAGAITDPAYWQRICPQLHVSQSPQTGSTLHLTPAVAAEKRQLVDTEGACTVHADELQWRGLDWTVLATAVVQLMQHGWPPSFLLMYDEAWQLVHQLGGVMKATTGNEVNMDILAWYVDPNRGEVGFSPHRDRQPPDVPSSFRPDGSARYTTAWVPFTDACPDNSCLFMLPRWADPGYYAGDAADGPDPLPLALSTKESYQNIRAFPAEAGAAVIFTHRTIHWGSKGRQGYHTPRICLAAACADDSFEPPYFDRAKHLPCPSVAMRAALACGQMIVYHERFQLTPKQLALFKRTFMAHSQEFHATYRAKVLSEFVAATKEAQTAPTAAQQPPNTSQPVAATSNQGPAGPVGDNGTQGAGRVVGGKAAKALLLTAPVGAANGRVKGDSSKKRDKVDPSSLQDARPSNKKVKVAAAGAQQGHKGELVKATARTATATAQGKDKKSKQEQESEDDEDEGPDFEFLQLQNGHHGGNGRVADVDEDDVDLIDEELDAVLEARLGGLDDEFAFEDDFTSDMEADEPPAEVNSKKGGKAGVNSLPHAQQVNRNPRKGAVEGQPSGKMKANVEATKAANPKGNQKKGKQQGDSDDEEEGPGFEFLQLRNGRLKDQHDSIADVDDDDVDLIDEELDAVLEARLGGLDDDFAFEDDFTFDMEAGDAELDGQLDGDGSLGLAVDSFARAAPDGADSDDMAHAVDSMGKTLLGSISNKLKQKHSRSADKKATAGSAGKTRELDVKGRVKTKRKLQAAGGGVSAARMAEGKHTGTDIRVSKPHKAGKSKANSTSGISKGLSGMSTGLPRGLNGNSKGMPAKANKQKGRTHAA